MVFLRDSDFLPIAQIKASQVDSVVKGGLALTAQKRELAQCQVVFECAKGIKPGTKIYLRPDAGFMPWNKELLMSGSVEFVLAPVDAIWFIET